MMTKTLKVPRGDELAIDHILKVCNDFWIDHKWLEIDIKPLSGKATPAQNDCQHAWFAEAQRQGDMTAEEYRGNCKAYCGIPILCRDSEEYRLAYEELIRPLPPEKKIKMMMRPIDFPVTRAMNKAQKSEYLDAVYHRLTVDHGIHLEPREK